jgi:hypothetical protein
MGRQLLANVDALPQELGWYQRHLLGRRSEKLDPNQQLLFDLWNQAMEEHQVASQTPVPKPPAQPSPRHGRVALPPHLPRERTEYHPPQEALVCPGGGQPKERRGEEITEQLDYVPASFIVRQHVRVKYACKKCQEGGDGRAASPPEGEGPAGRRTPGSGADEQVRGAFAVAPAGGELPVRWSSGRYFSTTTGTSSESQFGQTDSLADLLPFFRTEPVREEPIARQKELLLLGRRDHVHRASLSKCSYSATRFGTSALDVS